MMCTTTKVKTVLLTNKDDRLGQEVPFRWYVLVSNYLCVVLPIRLSLIETYLATINLSKDVK